MTTVAYDGNTVAADRYWGTCYGDKLSVVGTSIIGYTGPAHMYQRVLDYLSSGGDPPDLSDDAEVLVVDTTTGRATLYDNEMDALQVEAPIAIGTGFQIALGCMLGGGNSMQAVKAAAEFDPFTKLGGGITAFSKKGKAIV